MTAHILQSELLSLIQESKRKHPDIREVAAEKSLADLRALPATSESQLAGDLVCRLRFVDPFVLAFKSRNGKLAPTAIVCVQRLVASKAIPVERLQNVLEGMREMTSQGLDVQLKLLQTLPSLLQNYSDALQGNLLEHTLDICGVLQASKTAAVAGTATATLQQLIVSVFEKVTSEDASSADVPIVNEVETAKGSISVSAAAYDALRVFNDLCLLIEDTKPQFLRIKSIAPLFVLELIESILTNSADLFQNHPEQLEVLRNSLVPALLKSLSERQSFAVSVRVSRIILLILKRHMTALPGECEMALGLLIHLMDPDASQPWKRILCMEIFRGLYSEHRIIRQMFAQFDERKGSKNILRDHMAAMVRLASEKPALIGLSHQSTVPHRQSPGRDLADEQAAMEASGVAGVIGSAVSSADANVTGISSEWSTMKLPCMDHLDKPEPPSIPDTYVYTLALNCISSFTEGLARFILPLTVPGDSRARRKQKAAKEQLPEGLESDGGERNGLNRERAVSTGRSSQLPLNPLELSSHAHFDSIKTCAAIVDSCWPAFLATCSTFFYAALDSEFYHGLVRSFQKMTQVAGLLRATTPRDALLTTLGKAAVPADALTAPTITSPHPNTAEKKFLSVDSPTVLSSSIEVPQQSVEGTTSSLTTRNLLCLRALVNLGIALGPTLNEEAWSIVLETLQQAELIITASTQTLRRQNSTSTGDDIGDLEGMTSQVNIGGEMAAVRTATSRMFESTADYPHASFLAVLRALLKLSGLSEPVVIPSSDRDVVASPRSPRTARRPGRMHQASRSISITFGKSRIRDDELKFVVEKTKDLAKANLSRLTKADPQESGWDIMVRTLMEISYSSLIDSSLRMRASAVLNKICLETIRLSISEDDLERSAVHTRGLGTLKSQVTKLDQVGEASTTSQRGDDLELHDQVLITLHSILEQCGEDLVAGWDLTFELLCSVFSHGAGAKKDGASDAGSAPHPLDAEVLTKSPKLVRTAFASLQLVGSDFLGQLTAPRLLDLEDSLYLFGAQKDDLNISLTITTFFWSLADHLRGGIDELKLSHIKSQALARTELAIIAADTDKNVSLTALWVYLLLKLKALALNDKVEVRNGAVRVILRIFEAYGDYFSPADWNDSFELVLLDLLEDNISFAQNQQLTSSIQAAGPTLNWHETTTLLIEGLSELYNQLLTSSTCSGGDIPQSFASALLSHLDTASRLPSMPVYTAVLRGFGNVISHINELVNSREVKNIQQPAIAALSFWREHNPVKCNHLITLKTANQEAVAAFLDSGRTVWLLTCSTINQQDALQMLDHVTEAVVDCVIPKHRLDITTSLSEEQRKAIEITELVHKNFGKDPSKIIPFLAKWAESATITQDSAAENASTSETKRPSRVELARVSMNLIEQYITNPNQGIASEVALSRALGSLKANLDLGASDSLKSDSARSATSGLSSAHAQKLRKAATTGAVSIIVFTSPHLLDRSSQSELGTIFEDILDIVKALVAPYGLGSRSRQTLQDQKDDCESLEKLHVAVRPLLFSTRLPENVRFKYSQALFDASHVYEPFPLIPESEISVSTVVDSTRPGRTIEFRPTGGLLIAYCTLDLLFDLASSPMTTAAAFPWLVYRAARPINAYIADRPLRGLQPSFLWIYDELVAVLEHLLALEMPSENTGRPAREHLDVLRPVFVKMIGVASKGSDEGDRRVFELTLKAL